MNEYENMTKEELLTRCLFLEEVVEERNEQIEKMKNCNNCRYNESSKKQNICTCSYYCNDCNRWELAE